MGYQSWLKSRENERITTDVMTAAGKETQKEKKRKKDAKKEGGDDIKRENRG